MRLSNIDIPKWCDLLRITIKGVFSRNEPKPLCHSPCIINLDDSMCLYQTKSTKPISCSSLTVVDVASRFKEAELLATKEGKEVATSLERIYRRSPLRWPKLLQVDPGREFMGAVSQLLAKHDVKIRPGCVDIHPNQAIAERFNRTFAERLNQIKDRMHG